MYDALRHRFFAYRACGISDVSEVPYLLRSCFAAELMNTAVELICNAITTEYSETIKRIKDISAAAVLLAALFSAILGLCVFLSKEVLSAIGETFLSYPIVPIAVFVSLPLFIWFIIGRKNDER